MSTLELKRRVVCFLFLVGCGQLPSCGYLPGSTDSVRVGYVVMFADGSQIRMDVAYQASNGQLARSTVTTPWHSPLQSIQPGAMVRLTAQVSGNRFEPSSSLNCGVDTLDGSFQQASDPIVDHHNGCLIAGIVRS